MGSIEIEIHLVEEELFFNGDQDVSSVNQGAKTK